MLHELTDVGICRAQHDVLGRACLHDAPALEYRRLVAELQRLVEIVCDEQDRLAHARLQREQFVLQLGADQRIERENGSSISRTGASVANARARPTRCCMPPDSS